MSTDRFEFVPEAGVPWAALEQQLGRHRLEDTELDKGVFGVWWPSVAADVYQVAMNAYSLYGQANAMYAFELPGLAAIDTELKQMIKSVLSAPEEAVTTVTAGGTESNILAVRAAREQARARGLGGRPNIVVADSAHPSFDKACDFLDMDIVRVPLGDDFRARVELMSEAIDEHTVMLVGSAPQYPHGVVDDVRSLATVAENHDIWMHVDSCVGGFLLPFLQAVDPGTPEFDFGIPGVWSVSADLHKFGHCTHGTSSLTVRSPALYEFQRYSVVRGSGGTYATAGILGSRPGGIVAAAWATMRYLGVDGYTRIATAVARNAQILSDAVADIEGVEMLCRSEAGIVVIKGSPEVPVPELVEALRRHGRPAYWTQTPPALHLVLDPVDEPAVGRYLDDLRAAVADCVAGTVRDDGSRAVYSKD